MRFRQKVNLLACGCDECQRIRLFWGFSPSRVTEAARMSGWTIEKNRTVCPVCNGSGKVMTEHVIQMSSERVDRDSIKLREIPERRKVVIIKRDEIIGYELADGRICCVDCFRKDQDADDSEFTPEQFLLSDNFKNSDDVLFCDFTDPPHQMSKEV